MSATLRRTEKASKSEAVDKLMSYMVDVTDERFTVKFHDDDGGSHISAIIERNDADEVSFKKRIPSPFMGWRSVMLFVPKGYIEVFYDDKKGV